MLWELFIQTFQTSSKQLSLAEEQELNEYEQIEHLIVMLKS
jgi:hypothetical protein